MRLFIAIDIPKEIKLKISNSFLFARDSLEFAEFIEADNLHITLAFLGEVEESLSTRVKEAIEAVTLKYSSESIKLSNAVIGPDKNKARMIWLKLEDASQKYLESISQSLKIELKNRNVPFDNNHEFFNGHVTLARFGQGWQYSHELKNEKGKKEDIEFIENSLPETFEASFDSKSITLFLSVKNEGQRLYKPLFESNFKG